MTQVTSAITRLDLSDTKDVKTSDKLIPLPTVEEQDILNELFWTLYYNSSISSSSQSLRSVIGLMQQIADGRAIRRIRVGFGFASPEQQEYLNGLEVDGFERIARPFDTKLTDIDTSHIRFNATGLNVYGCSCLFNWASTNDEDPVSATSFPSPESVVAQTFQLLKRSGGVTLDLACTVPLEQFNVNAFYMALRSSFPYWVQCLLSETSLDEGWSRLDTNNNTPLSAEISGLDNEDIGPLVVRAMTDDAINEVNIKGKSLVWLAVASNRLSTLRTLLLRPALDLNPLPGDYGLQDAVREKRLTDANRLQIGAVFDDVALVFSQIPFWIHDAVYYGYHLTLDLPVCMIIYHYYRMPYPNCQCDPKLAAAAPTKHSPFCFCVPS